METFDIVASIVTFHTSEEMLRKVICSFYDNSSLKMKLVIVDNSSLPRINAVAKQLNCDYIDAGSNLGFGAAHNLAINKYASSASAFAVVNPDVILNQNCIDTLYKRLMSDHSLALVAPKILNPDGSIQYVHRGKPSFLTLLGKRFFIGPLKRMIEARIQRYELRHQSYEDEFSPFCISGCFMLFNAKKLLEIRGFDDRFFMYMEDIDISRRVAALGRLLVIPSVSLTHEWGRGGYKNFKLLSIHIRSALKYFWKWGLG